MLMRKLIVGSLAAAAIGAVALPAAATTGLNLVLDFGPPPAYYEVVPAPRAGFVWVPGYWDWRAHRYHWVRGHWVKSRPGYAYASPRYHRYGGRWHYQHGGWRDRDGDGVPNRWDRFPRDPWRR